MKKLLIFALSFVMIFILMACGSTETNIPQTLPSVSEENSTAMVKTEVMDEIQSNDTQQMEDFDMEDTKILVAYFSRTGENYSVGYIEKGNTHIVADMIAEQIDGDMFEIRTVTPYPDDYDECTEIAKQEQDKNTRPELAESVKGMENYDVIFLGYPKMEYQNHCV